MASDAERKHRLDRPPVPPAGANDGFSASPENSTAGFSEGSAKPSVPGDGAATRGRPSPLPLWCEAAGNPLHRRLSLENRQLAERLRGLEVELRTLRQALRRAASEALTDPLTGLANRRAFDAALAALATSGPPLGATPGAIAGGWAEAPQLLIADIDNFKALNDTHGHAIGDAVLRIAGELMAASVRRGSTIARLGGDEFALLLPGQTTADPAGIGTRAIAERLCSRIAGRSLLVRGRPELAARITLSIGIAGWQPAERPAEWYARADRALYAAKRNGRNCVVLATAAG